MLSFNVPVKVMVSFAFWPAGIVSLNLTCGSLGVFIVGYSWGVRDDFVARSNLCGMNFELICVEGYGGCVFDDVQTRKLSVHVLAVNRLWVCLLNDDSPLVGEVTKIGLESQVIVERLHIGW